MNKKNNNKNKLYNYKLNKNKHLNNLYEVESFLNSLVKTSNVVSLYSAIKKNSNL